MSWGGCSGRGGDGQGTSCFGESACRRRGDSRVGARLLLPAVHTPPAGVHEEVADGGELQAQLLGDGDLHFLGGTLVLLEDGEKRSALEVCENQARFLLRVVPLFVRLLLFAFAGWGREGRERKRVSGCVCCPQTQQSPPDTSCDPPTALWSSTEEQHQEANTEEQHRAASTQEQRALKRISPVFDLASQTPLHFQKLLWLGTELQALRALLHSPQIHLLLLGSVGH